MPATERRKNPTIAWVCTLFLPGLGHIYNGQYIMGPVVMLLTLFLYSASLLFGFALHLFLIFDAANTARKINTRTPEDERMRTKAVKATYTPRNMAIAGVVIAAFIGGVVFLVMRGDAKARRAHAEAMSKSSAAASSNESPSNQHSWPAASDDGWQEVSFHGIKIKTPSKPNTEAPQTFTTDAGKFIVKEASLKTSKYQISVARCDYDFEPTGGLDSMLEGSISAVDALETTKNFRSVKGRMEISGKQAATADLRFDSLGESQSQQLICVFENRTSYVISVIGRERDVPEVWEKVRASVRIED